MKGAQAPFVFVFFVSDKIGMMNFSISEGDCLELLRTVPNQSIDLILCDLPYGTTACDWDSVIDLKELWSHYKRIIKLYRPIVLTASQPFTTVLAASNLAWLKYEWVWVKNRPTNFAHAKNKPMKAHENVLVFSEGTTVHSVQSAKRMPYYPQNTMAVPSKKFTKRATELTDAFFSARKGHGEFERDVTGYSSSVLEIATDQLGLHPTAKPVALFEFLVRTYTKPGDIVLDNCVGVGTTGIACANSDRNFTGMEKDRDFYEIAVRRVEQAYSRRRHEKAHPILSLGDEVVIAES